MNPAGVAGPRRRGLASILGSSAIRDMAGSAGPWSVPQRAPEGTAGGPGLPRGPLRDAGPLCSLHPTLWPWHVQWQYI